MRRSFVGLICGGALVLLACEGTVGEPGEDATKPQTMNMPPAPIPGHPQITTFACTPDTGAAPFITTCNIAAIHPDNRPLRCTLTLSDGSPAPFTDSNCAIGLTQAVTFQNPGTFTVTLSVRDDLGVITQDVRTMIVTVPVNRPPVIASFTATPSAGTAPLKTTFAWAVSDPEGDALSCSIDVGNDGSVEYPALDCSKLSQAHTLVAPSTVPVLFGVKDAKGLSAQSVIMLSARAPAGDVRISKVEWGQVIVSETPRLVEGKPALVRVHVLADKAGIAGVTVDAEGFNAAGVSLGKLPLVGPATAPLAEVPADLKQQWTGTVPAAWVEVGLELRLKVDPLDAIAETDEVNNSRSVKPVVGKGNLLQFTSVPVVNAGMTGTLIDVQPIVVRMWPVKSLVNQNRAPYTFGGTLQANSTGGWGQLLQDIAGLRQADGSNRNYYGFVRVNYGSGIAGIGYVGMEAATGRDDSTDTAAHELGHNLGRQHAPCGGVAMPDPSYPYAGGKIGSWGYDAVNKLLLNPANFTDLMGYCDPAWTSDYNYKAVQSYLEAAPYIPPQAPAMYVPVVLVAGVIRAGAVTLRPVHRMLAASSPSGDGAWAVRLHTVDGREVVHPFTPVEVADGDQSHFTLLLADPGPLAGVEVLHGVEVVSKSTSVGGEAPRPALRFIDDTQVRLSWDAGRFSSAEVAHLAEDGTRTTLALWLTGGDAVIRTDGLGPGRFEVSLSDGIAASRTVLSAAR
jgi:hypothetical protein